MFDDELTAKNVVEIGTLINALLMGQKYIFVSLNEGFHPSGDEMGLEVRPNQQMKTIKVWTNEDGHAGFDVYDSFGTWGANTFRPAHVFIGRNRIMIEQKSGAGYNLTWKIVVQ